MKLLLDTNICIYLIKRKPSRVLERFNQYGAEEIGLSSITVAELMFGVEKSKRPQQNQEALEQFLAPLAIAQFDYEAAQEYGRVRAVLEKRGTPIGPLDLLIGAHALSLGVPVVTNNLTEFSRIPRLSVLDWVSKAT